MMATINKTPDNKSWQGRGERRALICKARSHYVAQDIFEPSSLPYLSKRWDYRYVYRTFKLLSKAAPNLFPLNKHTIIIQNTYRFHCVIFNLCIIHTLIIFIPPLHFPLVLPSILLIWFSTVILAHKLVQSSEHSL